jgi:hypothetical protein
MDAMEVSPAFVRKTLENLLRAAQQQSCMECYPLPYPLPTQTSPSLNDKGIHPSTNAPTPRPAKPAALPLAPRRSFANVAATPVTDATPTTTTTIAQVSPQDKSILQEGTRVFVQNLPPRATWKDVKAHFSGAGHVVLATVSAQSRCGLVQFESAEMATRAIDTMRYYLMEGYQLKVYPDLKDSVSPPPVQADPSDAQSVFMLCKCCAQANIGKWLLDGGVVAPSFKRAWGSTSK